MRRAGSRFLILVMAAVLAVVLPAAVPSNRAAADEPAFSLQLNQSTVTPGAAGTAVTMTLRADRSLTLCSMEYRILYDPDILSLEKIEGGELNITAADVNMEKGIVSWQFEDDPAAAETFSVITFSVKEGISEGSYALGVSGLTLSEDWGMTALVKDVSVSTTLTVTDEPVFKACSILLSGQIGVNFFLALPSFEERDYAGSYMEFTVNGKTQRADFDPSNRSVSEDWYGFTCPVNSIQMADRIEAVYHYGEGRTLRIDYSVKDYIDYVRGHEQEFDQKTRELVYALADYGHYIQPFLAGARGWTVGSEHAEMPAVHQLTQADAAEAAEATAPYAIQRPLGEAGLKKITFALHLDSETSIFLYLEGKEDYSNTIRVYINDDVSNAAEKQTDGRYRAAVRGIPAHRLDETQQFVITAGGETRVRVSGLSYVHELLTADQYSSDACAEQAATALYRYYRAAKAYM